MRKFVAIVTIAAGTFGTCATIATHTNFGAVRTPTAPAIEQLLDTGTDDIDTPTAEQPADDDEEEL